MTHRAFLPAPANDVAGLMGEYLYRESIEERVDLNDVRSVLRALHDANWSDADKAAYAEAAIDYARARVRRRNLIRDNLAGTGDTLAFAIMVMILLVLSFDGQARAADQDGHAASAFIGLFFAVLPLVFPAAFVLYLRLRGRPITADEDEAAYGDTTMFGEPER